MLDLALTRMRTHAGLWSLSLKAGQRFLTDERVVIVDYFLGFDAQRRQRRVAAADVHHHQQHVAVRHRLHRVRPHAFLQFHVIRIERDVAQVQEHL